MTIFGVPCNCAGRQQAISTAIAARDPAAIKAAAAFVVTSTAEDLANAARAARAAAGRRLGLARR